MSAPTFENFAPTTMVNNELRLVNQEDCSICYGEDNSKAVTTACGHVFHENCLNPWLAKSKTCPLCRRDLSVPIEFKNWHILAAAGAALVTGGSTQLTGAFFKSFGEYLQNEGGKFYYISAAIVGAYALKSLYDTTKNWYNRTNN